MENYDTRPNKKKKKKENPHKVRVTRLVSYNHFLSNEIYLK